MQDDHPHLTSLRQRHRALDDKITEAQRRPASDATVISELKRKKLRIKEEIAALS